MAYTDINSEDRLVQQTFANHLRDKLGWESVYAWNEETFGERGTLGRADTREVVLTRDLRAAIARLNPALPASAVDDAVQRLTRHDFSRSLLQLNQEFYKFIRDGVPVKYASTSARLSPTASKRCASCGSCCICASPIAWVIGSELSTMARTSFRRRV